MKRESFIHFSASQEGFREDFQCCLQLNTERFDVLRGVSGWWRLLEDETFEDLCSLKALIWGNIYPLKAWRMAIEKNHNCTVSFQLLQETHISIQYSQYTITLPVITFKFKILISWLSNWIMQWLLSSRRSHPKRLSDARRGHLCRNRKVRNLISKQEKEVKRGKRPIQVSNRTRKRYIILNVKIAREKPIKSTRRKSFREERKLREELWSRCSYNRRHYPMKLSVIKFIFDVSTLIQLTAELWIVEYYLPAHWL